MIISTPEYYVVTFEAIDVPFLVIFSSNDETMHADAFHDMMDEGAGDGEFRVVEEENYSSIHHSHPILDIVYF